MKSMSIGTRAASPSKRRETANPKLRRNGRDRRSGFTLIEALVALALVLAFAAVLGPLMFQSRRILVQGDGQVTAELLLRSLLARPFNRAGPELGIREGEIAGLRWRIDVEPMSVEALSVDGPPRASGDQRPDWVLYRVKVAVLSRAGQILTGETARLGIGG
ncbi:prepilin-type N-terminal cleavage/methylation domain-containing protein [Methyloferula stellata]|uniref:prepilin-type N-terminal cleavage/methylation domain-containing protein n=1 Tax=Methyloferula stellata TaxID=876270 RepID=UPI001FCB68BD|nr:prepilin-type N-terminal cleavage/methylation domain-containing protein [Methyloferula stellata]